MIDMPVSIYYRMNLRGIGYSTEDPNHDGSGKRAMPKATLPPIQSARLLFTKKVLKTQNTLFIFTRKNGMVVSSVCILKLVYCLTVSQELLQA